MLNKLLNRGLCWAVADEDVRNDRDAFADPECGEDDTTPRRVFNGGHVIGVADDGVVREAVEWIWDGGWIVAGEEDAWVFHFVMWLMMRKTRTRMPEAVRRVRMSERSRFMRWSGKR